MRKTFRAGALILAVLIGFGGMSGAGEKPAESDTDLLQARAFAPSEESQFPKAGWEKHLEILQALSPQHEVGPEINAYWTGDPRWMGGFNWGGQTFFGSIGNGDEFFVTGKNTLDIRDYVEIEMRLTTDTSGQSVCQRFLITGGGFSGFDADGPGVFPGSAWDVSDSTNPRRVNICFTEWDDGGGPNPAPDSSWNPNGAFSPFYGKREYVLLMLSDYDSGAAYAGKNLADDTLDVIYAWWPKVETGHTFFETDSAKINIVPEFFQFFSALPGDGQVQLSWSYLGPGVEKYRIYHGMTSPAGTVLDSVPDTVSTYLHTGLTNGTKNYYRLEMVGAGNVVLYQAPEVLAIPSLPSYQMVFLGNWNGWGNYGDIWGYTDSLTGKEYAIICARGVGVSIVDINVTPPQETATMFSCGNCGDAKDVKLYGHYVFMLHEVGHIQVFDISDVTNPVEVGTITPDGNGAHNCYVRGNYLYVVGNHGGGGLEIFNVTNPDSAVKVGEFQPDYYHDIDIRNDTLYACRINGGGMDILNISNKSAPSFIANFNYAGSGAHNVEISEDGKYVFVGDEVGSNGNWTRAFDVSDPNSVIKVADLIVNPLAVVHNCYIKDSLLYIAHYTEGLRVWNVSDPTGPYEVAFYDTYEPDIVGFDGAWSVYPYFASGKIVVSDMSTGLYVVALDSISVPACSAIPGDANNSGTLTLSDVIVDVNWVFNKPGWPACPANDKDCWLSGLLCRGDWNASSTVSLSDVIQAVNYIFGKPGGPWTPLESGVCCQAIP